MNWTHWNRRTLGVSIASCGVALACAAPPPVVQTPNEIEVVEAVPSAPPTKPHAELPALSADEQSIAAELRSTLAQLESLGPRTVQHPLELADATDWIHSHLEKAGLGVERQGFSYGEEVVQNLVVRNQGLRRGDHHIVVGARLDTPAGGGGADDNASGVAALMVLAKRFSGRRALRSVDFVWFTDAATRAADSAGTHSFIASANKDAVELVAMVELYGLGVYSDQPGSQQESSEFVNAGDVADFVSVVAYPEHAAISDHFVDAFKGAATLPVKRFTALSDSPPVAQSLHADFLQAGVPALLVFDTHRGRYADFGGPGDTAAKLDYERMARAVVGLEQAILALSGPLGEAPLQPAKAPNE